VTDIDLEVEFFKNQTTLMIIPSEIYNEVIFKVPRQLSGKKICYITLNKTYNALKEILEKEDEDILNNMVFIDAITQLIGKSENTDDCYFVSSPQALTELSIVIYEFMKYKFDYIIFDSLTTLLIYQKAEEPVIKFVYNIANKIKTIGSKGIFYALKTDEHKLLTQEVSMVIDNTLDLSSENIF
jgi:hypothetical protein